MCIDPGYEPSVFSERMSEVLGIGPTIFTPQNHMFFVDLMIGAGLVDLFNKVIDSLWRVPHTKRLSKNIPIAITKHHGMFLLGVVHGYHHDLLAVARLFVDAHKFLTLLLKNVSLFHVKLLSTIAARGIATAVRFATGLMPDGFYLQSWSFTPNL
jgi:hypothetical protein